MNGSQILVVEDDARLGATLQRVLTAEGHHVDLVGDGVGFGFSFTTDFNISNQGPQVTGLSPGNGLTQVAINAQIQIQFNEPVDGESLGQVTLSANGTAVNTSSSLSNGNQLLPWCLRPDCMPARSTP